MELDNPSNSDAGATSDVSEQTAVVSPTHALRPVSRPVRPSSESSIAPIVRMGSIHAVPDDLQMMGGKDGDSFATFSPAEKIGFSQHINQCFEHDEELSHLLPLDYNSNDLFEKHYDGLILCTNFILVTYLTHRSITLMYFIVIFR